MSFISVTSPLMSNANWFEVQIQCGIVCHSKNRKFTKDGLLVSAEDSGLIRSREKGTWWSYERSRDGVGHHHFRVMCLRGVWARHPGASEVDKRYIRRKENRKRRNQTQASPSQK